MEVRVDVRVKKLGFWSRVGIIFGVSMLASLLALRSNNQNMANLRQELINADKSGDTGKVEIAAKNLQHYVAAHMNTDTGRVALQSSYNQAADAAMKAAQPSDVDVTAYQTATENCRPQLNSYGYRAWASCVANEVGTKASTQTTIEEVAPDPDLYYVDYAAPRWSSDLAGWSLVTTLVSGVVLAGGAVRWTAKRLKNSLSIALKH